MQRILYFCAFSIIILHYCIDGIFSRLGPGPRVIWYYATPDCARVGLSVTTSNKIVVNNKSILLKHSEQCLINTTTVRVVKCDARARLSLVTISTNVYYETTRTDVYPPVRTLRVTLYCEKCTSRSIQEKLS